MRNVAINDVDHLPRRVLALGSDVRPTRFWSDLATAGRSFCTPCTD